MSDDTARGHEPKEVARIDATSIRGVAHPLRLKILGLLRSEGPATATSLAERLGQNTGATSYHLRQLATYGFIVEDAARGTGRERWWRAAHTTTYFDRSTLGDDESGEVFLRSIGQIYMEGIQRAIDQHPTLPAQWRDTGTLSDWVFRLTPDEARQLTGELYEVMGRYRRHDPDEADADPADARRFMVQIQAFPDDRRISAVQPDETEALD